MYAHVARYEFQPGMAAMVLHQAERSLVPPLRAPAGFHPYEAIQTAPDHALVISRWESEASAAAIHEATRTRVAEQVGAQVGAVHTTAGDGFSSIIST